MTQQTGDGHGGESLTVTPDQAPKSVTRLGVVALVAVIAIAVAASRMSWGNDAQANASRADESARMTRLAREFGDTIAKLGASPRDVSVLGYVDRPEQLVVQFGPGVQLLPKQTRLTMARDIVSSWRSVSHEDLARVKIVDRHGNEVGGTTWGGSPWVE